MKTKEKLERSGWEYAYSTRMYEIYQRDTLEVCYDPKKDILLWYRNGDKFIPVDDDDETVEYLTTKL